MRVPLSWLRDFSPFELEASELAATFDDLGLVVERLEVVGEGLDDVVVAEVVAIEPIEGADRIRKVTVDGGGAPVEVVCGAWNFEVGDAVPLAPVGSKLPGGLEVAARRMKGVRSDGMLCSGRELGLSDDGEGILVLGRASAAGAAPGTPLAEVLGIEKDVVFDLAIEANRPDAMSMAGVARDASARLRLPFELPEAKVEEGSVPVAELASVVVEAPSLAPRFASRVLYDVEVGDSPPWLTRRLVLAGMRPINSVVDASNYVMLELGQPTHPYDLDRLAGSGLVVRAAKAGEEVVTLDGQPRRLGVDLPAGGRSEDCVICDAESRPIGIAGVMGGASTEITAETRKVLLEAANFEPMAIARTSKRLGLRTEASVRFERGCDPQAIDRAMDRFAAIVVAGRGARGPGDLGPTPAPKAVVARGSLDVKAPGLGQRTVRLRTDRVNAVLGTRLGDDRIAEYLGRIGFVVTGRHDGVQDVEVPSFRPDTTREIDVIEEVARHHGYSSIDRTVPVIHQVGGLTPRQRERRLVRQMLADLGATEAWTPTLIAPGADEASSLHGRPLSVDNPLVREESVLRRRLLPGLVGALAFNAARRNDSVAFFEIGHVFWPPPPGGPLPDEREHLGVLLAREGDGASSAVWTWRALAVGLRLPPVEMEAGHVPGLHPTRGARLVAAGTELGFVGELDPEVLAALDAARQEARVGYLEVDLGLVQGLERERGEVGAPSRFPSSDIDLAFVVADGVPAASVEKRLRQAGAPLLESCRLIDVYRGPPLGPGERNLAYRLRFCAPDHTLTDAETAEARRRCIVAVEEALPARLRV